MIYKKSSNKLFIESSLNEAIDISRVSGKPVFCIENDSLVDNHKYANSVKTDTYVFLKCIKRYGV